MNCQTCPPGFPREVGGFVRHAGDCPRSDECPQCAALRIENEALVERTIRHLAEQGLLYGGLWDELEVEKLVEDTLIALGLVRYEVGAARAALAPFKEGRTAYVAKGHLAQHGGTKGTYFTVPSKEARE